MSTTPTPSEQASGKDLKPGTDLLGWLHVKLADAERALAAREQAASVWKSGTDEEWAASAKLHPGTAKAPPLTKAERMKTARREEGIATKCRHEVEMFKAVLSALVPSDGKAATATEDLESETLRPQGQAHEETGNAREKAIGMIGYGAAELLSRACGYPPNWKKGSVRWKPVSDLFQVGCTTAIQLCHALGIDPHEKGK